MSRFTRPFAQPAGSYNVIAPGSRLATLRGIRLLFLFIIAFFIFLEALFYLSNLAIDGENVFLPWTWFILPLIYLFNCILYTLHIQKLKRLEPLRLVAAQGDRRMLASEQPQAEANTIHLPVRINTYPVYYSLFRSFLYVVLVVSLTFIPIYFQVIPWHGWYPSPLEVGLFVVVTLCVFALLARFSRHPIEVTPQGIRARDGANKKIFIFWHEVRLFACYPDPDPLHDNLDIVYELSNASHTVYWNWRPRQGLFAFLIPFEEHNAQIQALCSIVVANAGLPLYDLGKASED